MTTLPKPKLGPKWDCPGCNLEDRLCPYHLMEKKCDLLTKIAQGKQEIIDVHKRRYDLMIQWMDTCVMLINTDDNIGEGTTKALEALKRRIDQHREDQAKANA